MAKRSSSKKSRVVCRPRRKVSASERRRRIRVLRDYACKSKKLTPALKKACAKVRRVS